MIAALDPFESREDMYLTSYRDAAPALLQEFERRYQHEGKRPAIFRQSRFLALPIIYLWRHFFELFLKKLNRKVAPLAGEAYVFRSHRLHELWADFRRMFLLVCPPEPGRTWDGFVEADELFRDLGSADPDAQATRYAVSRTDQPHFERFDAINVSSFARMCSRVMVTLDECEIAILRGGLERRKRGPR
jgi:hypothetical protein